MKYIDSRTMEFTDAEMIIKDHFDELLDEGKGIKDAARTVLTDAIKHGEALDPTFVAYLSDDTLRLVVTDE